MLAGLDGAATCVHKGTRSVPKVCSLPVLSLSVEMRRGQPCHCRLFGLCESKEHYETYPFDVLQHCKYVMAYLCVSVNQLFFAGVRSEHASGSQVSVEFMSVWM
jgi:hypothetical protein